MGQVHAGRFPADVWCLIVTQGRARSLPGKLIGLLRWLLLARKDWTPPLRTDVVVLDSTNLQVLKPLLGTHSYQVVPLDADGVCLAPSVFLRTLRFAAIARNFAVAQTAAVIEAASPGIVITFIDNSDVYQRAAALLPHRKFLAIQNGNRLLKRDNPVGGRKVYHDCFACFGAFEVDQYRQHGVDVKTFYPIGSIKDAYYRQYAENRTRTRRFDLCLVSQVRPRLETTFPDQYESCDLLTRHLRTFCEKHGKSICVALRKHPDIAPEQYHWEREWFQSRLGERAIVFPNVPGEYTTYELVDDSGVSLALHTTVLREGFGRGSRILACNFTGNSTYDFPVDGPWSLTDREYESFETRLLWLLDMSQDEYQVRCNGLPQYLVAYNKALPADLFLKQQIEGAVSTQTVV